MYSCTHASILPRNYALERIVGEGGEDVNLQNGNISTLFIHNKGFYQKRKQFLHSAIHLPSLPRYTVWGRDARGRGSFPQQGMKPPLRSVV